MKTLKKIPSWLLIVMGITIACGGTVITAPVVIPNNAVTDAKLRDSTGLSVIGRSANSTGDPADIVAASDGDVLRRSGTSLGFGSIPESSVTGVITDVTAGAGLTGGGSSGNVTVDITASADFSVGTDLLDLSSTITAPGTLDVAGNFSVATNKFTVTALNGNTLVAGTFTVSPMTSGSVWFAGTSGLLSQDNTNFNWNNTNKTLSVTSSTSSPALIVTNADATAGAMKLKNTNASGPVDFFVADSTDTSRMSFGYGNASYSDTARVGRAYIWRNTGVNMVIARTNTVDEYIDSAGRHGIGTSTSLDSNSLLHINSGTGGTAPISGSLISIERSGVVYATFKAATANEKGILFSNGSGAADGAVLYDCVSRGMCFKTGGGTTREFVDSNGSIFMGDNTNTAIADNVDVLTLAQTGTGQTTSGISMLTASNTGTYNATSGNITVYGLKSSVTSTRSAGANSVTNTAIYATSSGAQTNIALQTDAGNVLLNQTGGTFSTAGNNTLGDSTSDATTINGPLTALKAVGTTFDTLDTGTKANIRVQDNTALAAGVGGGILFEGIYTGSTIAAGGGIKLSKLNSTDGNYTFDLIFGARQNGNAITEAFRITGVDHGVTVTGTFLSNANSTLGDANADLTTIWGHVLYNGTAPSKNAGCDGSGTATVTGTDSSFKIATGTGSTACTITFSRTFTVAPACTVFPEGGAALPTCTISATQIVCTVNAASTTYNFMCATSSGGA